MRSFNSYYRAAKARFGVFLRDQDIFGHQMQLNFNGEDTFKTSFGGFISLFSRAAVIIYMIFQLSLVLNNDQTNVTTTRFTRNLLKDKHKVELNQTNFNIAFRLVYVAEPGGLYTPPVKIENVYKYFNLRVQQQNIKFEQVRFNLGKDP